MTDFDPGEGWRKVNVSEYRNAEYAGLTVLRLHDNSGSPTFWVRKDPSPSLPTEANTVIRMRHVYGSKARVRYVLEEDGRWRLLTNRGGLVEPIQLMQEAAADGFEVLASPRVTDSTWTTLREGVRRETAKAVLESVLSLNLVATAIDFNKGNFAGFQSVASDFGVEL